MQGHNAWLICWPYNYTRYLPDIDCYSLIQQWQVSDEPNFLRYAPRYLTVTPESVVTTMLDKKHLVEKLLLSSKNIDVIKRRCARWGYPYVITLNLSPERLNKLKKLKLQQFKNYDHSEFNINLQKELHRILECEIDDNGQVQLIGLMSKMSNASK